MLYITRIVFLLFNYNAFQKLSWIDFLSGIWLDLITIGLFYLPYYVLFLIPFKKRSSGIYKISFKILFHAINLVLTGLNLMDVEYFKFTSKRSTFDLFSIISAGNDISQLLTTFLKDFWFLILILILVFIVTEWFYRKTEKVNNNSFSFKKELITFIVLVPVLFIMGRGGFGLKPVGIIEASKYYSPENSAFVLTTAFTMIKTIDQTGLQPVTYFKNGSESNYFSPLKTTVPANILPKNTNVVVIMLESFGSEFVNTDNPKDSYAPYLDSIIDKSLSFEYSFANGKKSIEAVPAVIASMPTLMDNPYISSPYGDNKINTLPNILKKHGYSSGFYHGATNGSMRFDGFAKICGFDDYYGRFEYDNDKHFDQTWGILDEYFNPWSARKMSELKQPFFSTLFTLSSHHPYFIPEHMRSKVKKGPQPICASINYGDYALRKFFEEAKKQDWFENTIFVLLADHSPSTNTELFNQRTHMYQIPIAFYDPMGRLKPFKSKEIFQQMDILPTLLDLLNIKDDYYAFGNSFFQQSQKEAITYLEGTYYYFKKDHMLTFQDGRVRNLYNFKSNIIGQIDSISVFSKLIKPEENRIKAMIQRYSSDLINNKTLNEAKN